MGERIFFPLSSKLIPKGHPPTWNGNGEQKQYAYRQATGIHKTWICYSHEICPKPYFISRSVICITNCNYLKGKKCNSSSCLLFSTTDYYKTGQPSRSPTGVYVAEKGEMNHLRESAQLARRMLDFACALAKPGSTTEEIDILCHEEIIRNGAYPSPINYCGFPKAICTSVNDIVCHGNSIT